MDQVLKFSSKKLSPILLYLPPSILVDCLTQSLGFGVLPDCVADEKIPSTYLLSFFGNFPNFDFALSYNFLSLPFEIKIPFEFLLDNLTFNGVFFFSFSGSYASSSILNLSYSFNVPLNLSIISRKYE